VGRGGDRGWDGEKNSEEGQNIRTRPFVEIKCLETFPDEGLRRFRRKRCEKRRVTFDEGEGTGDHQLINKPHQKRGAD